jgi:hypothetical protein
MCSQGAKPAPSSEFLLVVYLTLGAESSYEFSVTQRDKRIKLQLPNSFGRVSNFWAVFSAVATTEK